MVAEIGIARRTQLNPYGAFRKLGNKYWGLLGLFGVVCGMMILSFYNVVAGWTFGYFVQIVFGDLMSAENFGAHFGGYVSQVEPNLIFSFLFMIMTTFIVANGVSGGIERSVKIMMPLLIGILLILIVYGLTLPNAGAGLRFYLIPDFSAVTGNTIYAALGQAFFSLSLGMGALITYGSYVSKKVNIVSSAALVTIVDTSIAFLAGLLIFPLIFSVGQSPSAGPGLVFVALPEIFASMGPIVGKVVGGSFFLLLTFAALTSTISMLEVPTAFLVDEKKWLRKNVAIGLAAVIFILSIPSLVSQGAVESLSNFMEYEGRTKSFLEFIIDLFTDVSLSFGGMMISIFVGWKWKTSNLSEEISSGFEGYRGSPIEKYLNVMIPYVCPVILGVIFCYTVYQKYLA